MIRGGRLTGVANDDQLVKMVLGRERLVLDDLVRHARDLIDV
jgi:hypothetical protein